MFTRRRCGVCDRAWGKGKPQKAIRAFGTMTDDLLALGDWLAEQQVTHVAMESTGVYWPVWNLLENLLCWCWSMRITSSKFQGVRLM